MDSFESNWKKKFDQSMADVNEDWLSPDPRVLDNIMANIEKEEKPKRRLWFLMFFLGFGLLISMAILTNLKDNSTILSKNEKNKLSTNTDENRIVPLTVADSKAEVQNKELQTQLVTTENINQNTELRNNSAITREKGVQKKNVTKTHPILPVLATNPVYNDGFKEEHIKNSISPPHPIMTLLKNCSSNSNRLFAMEIVETPIEPSNDKNQNISISTIAGIMIWQDRLSNSYSEALAPANFFNSSSIGNSFNLNIDYFFSSNWGINYSIGWNQLNTESGHNSGLTYNNVHENQTFDLTLATPYGFIKSDTGLRYSNQTSNTETPLLLDITSSHELSIFHMQLGVIKKTYLSPQWSLNTGIGFSLLNIIDIKNKVKELNTNHSDYHFQHANITQNQEAQMNDNLLGFHINLGIDYRITNQWSFGLQAGIERTTDPIFSQEDLNTYVRIWRLGLGVRYKL